MAALAAALSPVVSGLAALIAGFSLFCVIYGGVVLYLWRTGRLPGARTVC